MFGPIGGSEFLLIAVLALLLFGPRKLPQIGRSIGRALAEFRGATNEFKSSLEREVELEQVKQARNGLVSAGREISQAVHEVTRPEASPEAIDRSSAPSKSSGDDARSGADTGGKPDENVETPSARSTHGKAPPKS